MLALIGRLRYAERQSASVIRKYLNSRGNAMPEWPAEDSGSAVIGIAIRKPG
jgi:hypothetical protein